MSSHKQLSESLAVEVCKDLDYYDIYKFAEKFLTLKFSKTYTYERLKYEYEEKYPYLFGETH